MPSSSQSKTQKSTNQQLTQEDLSCSRLFKNVDIDSIWGLIAHCQTSRLEDGALLMEKGQSNSHLYMVISGQLKVYLDSSNDCEAAILEAGQTVGELSVIDGSAVSASVRASGDTSLSCLDEETFWRLIRASGEFCTNLLLSLSTRLRFNNHSLIKSKQLQWEFEQEAMTDGLTSLFNRRWLNEKLPRLIDRSMRNGQPFCLFMVDVDHFKKFNDTYGHIAGDNALCSVADAISQNVRPLDHTIRYGGEEFCVLLPNTHAADAKFAAARLVKAIGEHEVTDNNGQALPKVTISIGVAALVSGENHQEFLGRADSALYAAKHGGRNRFELAQ